MQSTNTALGICAEVEVEKRKAKVADDDELRSHDQSEKPESRSRKQESRSQRVAGRHFVVLVPQRRLPAAKSSECPPCVPSPNAETTSRLRTAIKSRFFGSLRSARKSPLSHAG